MPETYTTIQGQAWDQIAREALGDEKLMHHMIRANPEHRRVVFFSAGVSLKIPDVKKENRPPELPPWKK